MALSPSTQKTAAGVSIAALAIVALMLTVILGGWRASVLMSSSSAVHTASAQEASLLQIVEPIVGTGNVRISVTTGANGARTVLVLLDTQADAIGADEITMVERIVIAAMGLGDTSIDRLLIERAAFAPGLPGRLTTANYGELLGFVGLAGLLAWIALAARQARVIERPMRPVQASMDMAPIETATPAKRAVPKPMPPSEVAELVRRDPARAADVLRGWIAGKEDAA